MPPNKDVADNMCLETATAAASEEGPTLPKLADGAVWHEHRDGLKMKLDGDTEDIGARIVRIEFFTQSTELVSPNHPESNSSGQKIAITFPKYDLLRFLKFHATFS